jgi:OAA-family lectin sugar binding domain
MFVFRMWQRTSYDWEPEAPLTVHVSGEVSAAPEQLSWVAQDGTECAVALAPEMTTCYGHRRAADAHLVQIRGELDRRENLPPEGAFRGYEFATETLDVRWHPAGRLWVLVDDGAEAPPRWVAWRDHSGIAYSVGMWSPAWSGESDVMVVAGLKIKRAGVEFQGYRQLAGQAPEAYRGVRVNAEPSDTPVVSPVEPEPVVLEDVPAGTPLLPPVASVPLVRTDFSDDEAWAAISSEVTAVRHLSGGNLFSANVEPVNDVVFDGLTATQLCQLVPPSVKWSLLFAADRPTMTSAEHHVLVVDLDEDSLGRTFRATPPAIQEVENNLSLANMDWEDFAYAADDDGVVHPMLD